MKNWLFNPFRYIAGWTALGWGWSIMLLTGSIAWYSKTHFDAAIDVHVGLSFPFWVSLIEQLADWGFLVICFFIAGRLIAAGRFRFIDIAGTVALARAPYLCCAIIGFILPPFPGIKDISPGLILGALAELVFAVWMIALLYQAFTISCNVKGGKAIASFVIAVLAAEFLSRFLLDKVYAPFIH
jgi:hypothetical protein